MEKRAAEKRAGWRQSLSGKGTTPAQDVKAGTEGRQPWTRNNECWDLSPLSSQNQSFNSPSTQSLLDLPRLCLLLARWVEVHYASQLSPSTAQQGSKGFTTDTSNRALVGKLVGGERNRQAGKGRADRQTRRTGK